MSVFLVCLLLLIHTIADFVFQTDKMAKGKSSSNKILLTHTSVYTMFYAGLGFLPFFSWTQTLAFMLITFVAHTATDYVTSRMTKKLWAKGDVHNFFVVIGFDQLLHMIVLLTSFEWLLNNF